MKYKARDTSEKIINKDYSKEIIFGLNDFKEKGHLLQIVTIPANTKQRLHSHKIQTEVYFILKGETVINITGKDYLSKPGDSFIVDPGEQHFLWNKTDKSFKLIVFKINMVENSDDTK